MQSAPPPSLSSIMMEVRSFIEMIDAKSPPKVAAEAATTIAAALASASIVNDYPGRAIQGHSLSRGRAQLYNGFLSECIKLPV